MERTFDWKSRHDERSLNYPIRAVVGEPSKRRIRMWRQGTVLDQGSEGACVGFGWTGEILTKPEAPVIQPTQARGNEYALGVYKEAQKIDEWEGEAYSGTSVLAGAKIMQQRGLIGSYRWAFGIDDVRDAVLEAGPVVIGVPWYRGMYSTDGDGLVTVSGDKVGGHCILLTGYHSSMLIGGKRREVFRWRNSWGRDYGRQGSGFIEHDDLANLLKTDGGEACVPLDRKIVTKL